MMTEVRLIGTGTINDYKGAVEAMKRVSDIASSIEGVIVWEAFADEESGFVLLNERFASEQAFQAYEDAVDAADLRPTIRAAMELQQLVVLSPIADERVNALFDSMGAVRALPVASV